MFIAMNRFRVNPERTEEFETLWLERETHLQGLPGFVEFHMLRGPAEEDHVLYASHTLWRTRQHFEAWTHSEAFRAAHANAGVATTKTTSAASAVPLDSRSLGEGGAGGQGTPKAKDMVWAMPAVAPWQWTRPLAVPVEPDVKTMTIGKLASTGSGGACVPARRRRYGSEGQRRLYDAAPGFYQEGNTNINIQYAAQSKHPQKGRKSA